MAKMAAVEMSQIDIKTMLLRRENEPLSHDFRQLYHAAPASLPTTNVNCAGFWSLLKAEAGSLMAFLLPPKSIPPQPPNEGKSPPLRHYRHCKKTSMLKMASEFRLTTVDCRPLTRWAKTVTDCHILPTIYGGKHMCIVARVMAWHTEGEKVGIWA